VSDGERNQGHAGGGFDPAVVIVDPRKFTDYVLSPDALGGKDGVFLDRLGFRPNNLDDADFLVQTYTSQAVAAIRSGAYRLHRRDAHGQRITIVVVVRNVPLRSGWMVEAGGVVRLLTPFSGFVRPERSDQ
jgi:hypothetical protein